MVSRQAQCRRRRQRHDDRRHDCAHDRRTAASVAAPARHARHAHALVVQTGAFAQAARRRAVARGAAWTRARRPAGGARVGAGGDLERVFFVRGTGGQAAGWVGWLLGSASKPLAAWASREGGLGVEGGLLGCRGRAAWASREGGLGVKGGPRWRQKDATPRASP
eukprot:35801-Chlamydomonas_euryale.AAC.1